MERTKFDLRNKLWKYIRRYTELAKSSGQSEIGVRKRSSIFSAGQLECVLANGKFRYLHF